MNPDVVLERAFIVSLIEKAASQTECGWVCGKLLAMAPDGRPDSRVYSVGHALLRDGYAFNIGYGEVDTGQFEVPGEVFGANGAAVLYKRAMLLDAQERPGEFFDETMFHYFSDTDLDWRARLLGWRCYYVPQAVAYHRGDYTGARSDRWLIGHGLGSRYVSLFKNAFADHLAFRAVPLFAAHCALRTVVNPRVGLAMIKQVLQNLGDIHRKRQAMAQRRRLSRIEMRRWFAWSASQARQQTISRADRLRRFISES
jgi:GT2 family glycosyltransferase